MKSFLESAFVLVCCVVGTGLAVGIICGLIDWSSNAVQLGGRLKRRFAWAVAAVLIVGGLVIAGGLGLSPGR